MSHVRQLAVQALQDVIKNKRSLTEVLANIDCAEASEQSLLRELCYGVLRFYPQLNFLSQRLLDKPLKNKHHDIHCLLLLGFYQLLYLSIPSHAAINETVAVCQTLHKAWAKSLLNALLRRLQREQPQWLDVIANDDHAKYAHPAWLQQSIQHDWPDDWQSILLANNQRPPMTLRVNHLRGNTVDYQARLQQENIANQSFDHIPTAITLQQAMDVHALPGFANGDVSVQDAAAQLAAPLLKLSPGQRVLDACAAPGGKTCHILETQDNTVIALDNVAQRLTKIDENLQRLSLSAQLNCADATQINDWWDGQPFQRILLDAPCSASGVIRRHPDIKVLRQASDIASLSQQQYAMLQALWPCLEPQGLLLYVTCSVLRAENDAVISRFFDAQDDVQIETISHPNAIATQHGIQCLPGKTDGFYYALLSKG